MIKHSQVPYLDPSFCKKWGHLEAVEGPGPINIIYPHSPPYTIHRQQGELTHSQSRLLPLMPPSPTPRPNHAVDQARCRHSGQGPPPSHHDRPRLASGHRPPSALSPLAAAEVLCSGGSKCHLFKWVKARDEWRKNKVRRGRFGLYNLRSLLLLSCTNHRCPLAPPRPSSLAAAKALCIGGIHR